MKCQMCGAEITNAKIASKKYCDACCEKRRAESNKRSNQKRNARTSAERKAAREHLRCQMCGVLLNARCSTRKVCDACRPERQRIMKRAYYAENRDFIKRKKKLLRAERRLNQ